MQCIVSPPLSVQCLVASTHEMHNNVLQSSDLSAFVLLQHAPCHFSAVPIVALVYFTGDINACCRRIRAIQRRTMTVAYAMHVHAKLDVVSFDPPLAGGLP